MKVRSKSHYEINVFLQNTLAIIIGTLLFNTFFQSTWQKKNTGPFWSSSRAWQWNILEFVFGWV